jgi:hypothetical protein
MRFEGDICTLSFGLHTRRNQVQLQGTLWPHASANPKYDAVRPCIRFSTLFDQTELELLHQWLLNGSNDDILLPEPLQLARRLPSPHGNPLTFEIQFKLTEIPDWWSWDTGFPLRLHFVVQQPEFTFLVQSLDRHYWFDN